MIGNKITTLKGVLARARAARKEGKTIVTTNGCFDLLHPGHVHYLDEAKRLGAFLIVGVNSDAAVRALKGKGRPINNEKARLAMLAGLESVDFVFVFREKTPITFLNVLKPDIHVKGGDYRGVRIIEQDTVEKNHGKVCFLKFVSGYSTTRMIERILETYGKKPRQGTVCES